MLIATIQSTEFFNVIPAYQLECDASCNVTWDWKYSNVSTVETQIKESTEFLKMLQGLFWLVDNEYKLHEVRFHNYKIISYLYRIFRFSHWVFKANFMEIFFLTQIKVEWRWLCPSLILLDHFNEIFYKFSCFIYCSIWNPSTGYQYWSC